MQDMLSGEKRRCCWLWRKLILIFWHADEFSCRQFSLRERILQLLLFATYSNDVGVCHWMDQVLQDAHCEALCRFAAAISRIFGLNRFKKEQNRVYIVRCRQLPLCKAWGDSVVWMQRDLSTRPTRHWRFSRVYGIQQSVPRETTVNFKLTLVQGQSGAN